MTAAVKVRVEEQREEKERVDEDRIRVMDMVQRFSDDMRYQQRRLEKWFHFRDAIKHRMRFAMR